MVRVSLSAEIVMLLYLKRFMSVTCLLLCHQQILVLHVKQELFKLLEMVGYNVAKICLGLQSARDQTYSVYKSVRLHTY